MLAGKTFTNNSGVGIAGTMPNNGAWSNTPTTQGKVTIPAGYHNGSGYVDTTTIKSKFVIPSILHNRNGERGNDHLANTTVTINVKDYTKLTVGSVNQGDNNCSIKTDSGIFLSVLGSSNIAECNYITFSIQEDFYSDSVAGEFGFYDIIIE